MITLVFFVGLYFSGLALSFRNPAFGLYAYLLAYYFNPFNAWWGGSLPNLRWSFLAAIVTVITVVINQQKGKLPKVKNSFSAPLICFLVWVFMQQFWALSPHYHAQLISIAVNFCILYWMITKTCVDRFSIYGFLIANSIGCAYLGWYAMSLGRSGRLEGIGPPGLGDANYLALHIGAVLVMSAFMLLSIKKKTKFLYAPAAALMMTAIVLTQSRGALVGLVMAGLFILVNIPKGYTKQIIIYGVLALFSAALVVDDRFVDRIMSTFDSSANEEGMEKSAYSRFVLMEAQWKMFKDNSLFGIGHRGTMILSPDYISSEYLTTNGGSARRSSHNTYMTLLVEQGIPGTIAYIVLFLIPFKRFRALNRHDDVPDDIKLLSLGVTASFFGTLFSIFFVDAIRLEIYIWQVALIVALHNLYERENTQEKP